MLRRISALYGYSIRATDGDIGSVEQFYFDDGPWVIRYLIVDNGSTWRLGRRVLISPISFGKPDWVARALHVSLTRAQVKNSPNVDLQRPMTREQEAEYFEYYRYPFYWGGAGLWGAEPYPGNLRAGSSATAGTREPEPTGPAAVQERADSYLRSTKEVAGYHIQASDGEIGHVDDFLVDDENWAIRYLVIDTSNWWGGKTVLISPAWIRDVNWIDRKVSVNLTREAVKAGPDFDPARLDRQYEIALYGHYGQRGYWDE